MKGWKFEGTRHSLAAKGIKTTKKESAHQIKIIHPILTSEIQLNDDAYVNDLLSISNEEGVVTVSGGTDEPKDFPFFGGGCGFANLKGKGVEFKKYFEEQNEGLREKYGFNIFSVYKSYPSGFSVGVSNDYLTYIGEKAEKKIDCEHISVPAAFKQDLLASAQQDMSLKERILNSVKKQIEKKFPQSYVETRLD
jgi:hypothetical protein